MKASPYTNPALRDRIKAKITAGTKGGKAGQWSARKAQMVAIEYKKQGGSYTGAKSSAQSSLKKWTGEKWTTRDGKPAIRDNKGKTETRRYLPADAWAKLTPSQAKATDDKKRSASSQFVPNTKKAASARKDDMNDFWTRYDSWRRLGPNQMGKKCGRGWIGLRGACQRAKHHNGDKEATLKASKLALADKIRKRKGMKNRDEPRRKNRRLTADDVNKTPWKFTASQYQYAHKVHEPWIAEASPMQSGLMGKREKDSIKRKDLTNLKPQPISNKNGQIRSGLLFSLGMSKEKNYQKTKTGRFLSAL